MVPIMFCTSQISVAFLVRARCMYSLMSDEKVTTNGHTISREDFFEVNAASSSRSWAGKESLAGSACDHPTCQISLLLPVHLPHRISRKCKDHQFQADCHCLCCDFPLPFSVVLAASHSMNGSMCRCGVKLTYLLVMLNHGACCMCHSIFHHMCSSLHACPSQTGENTSNSFPFRYISPSWILVPSWQTVLVSQGLSAYSIFITCLERPFKQRWTHSPHRYGPEYEMCWGFLEGKEAAASTIFSQGYLMNKAWNW